MILFFGSYFESASDPQDLNAHFIDQATKKYETIKSDLNDVKREITDTKSKKLITITNEILRSQQEVDIANYLYLNNIEYEYEPIYPYSIEFSNKPYTPDFIIKQGDKICYLEHFGITESGANNRYSEDQLAHYKKTINDKIRLHKKHGTLLIYTFSQYDDKRPLIEHLSEALLNHGFEMSPRAQEDVMEKLINSEFSRYFYKFIELITRFINNFKANAYGVEEFANMSQSTTNVRSKLFLEITKSCYLAYQRF
jgi:DNA helicase-4